MAQLTVPKAPKEYATHYEQLLGVDFQADQTQVDRRRSPDMVNMISDFGGNPVKRDGYRNVMFKLDALVEVDGVTYGILATSSILTIYTLWLTGYEFTYSTAATVSKNFGTVKAAFSYQHKIYIIGSKGIAAYDTIENTTAFTGVSAGLMSTGTVGESAPACSEDIIPNIVIGLKPDGTAGTVLDDANVTTIYRMVSYQGDGTSTTYKIPNYDKMGTYVKVEVKNPDGDWTTLTAGTNYDIGTTDSNSVWHAVPSAGSTTSLISWAIDGSNNLEYHSVVDTVVKFTSAPAAVGSDQADNVRITFAPFSTEQIYRHGSPTPQNKGYFNETFVDLLNSGISTFQNNRMFIASKYKIYYSDVSQPLILSDLSWFEVDSEVVGFTRSNNYLVVLARDTGKSTIYLASEATRVVDSQTNQTETYYSVKESNAGIGAIAPKAIATLSDEPMFLSSTGIYGILTNWTSEKYAVNRSTRINRKLCKEANLENAVAIAYNDYLYLAINGRMYVLDGRHKESDRAGNKPFEAYYFEGLPAIEKMFVVGDRMYFIDDTAVYTWNDDLPEMERYLDSDSYAHCIYVLYGISDSPTAPPSRSDPSNWSETEPTPAAGEYLWYLGAFELPYGIEVSTSEITTDDIRMVGDPVCARWCSVYDDDDSPQRLKTLMKKGSMVTLVPHYQSGCEITLVKDGDEFEYLGSFASDLQSFEYIDFKRFSFNTNAVAFDNFTKKKIKKYKRLQIQIENNNAEPFGLTQITKTYIFGNYAKR